MNVLVDTSIWSQVLRRKITGSPSLSQELGELIGEARVRMIGPIRQEILSGIKSVEQFESLKTRLSTFPDLALETGDFEQAAEFFNRCRRSGIQGSNTDFLICSAAFRRNLEIFTTDKDFLDFRSMLPISLYSPRR